MEFAEYKSCVERVPFGKRLHSALYVLREEGVGHPVFEPAFSELAIAGLKRMFFPLASDFFHRIVGAID